MTANKPFKNGNDEVQQERVRQARISFNLALVTTAAGALGILVGVVLGFVGKPQLGTVATVGGTTISVCCHKFSKDANDRLDKLASDQDEDDCE